MGKRIEKDIERVEERLDELTLEQIIEKVSPEDVANNSIITKRMLASNSVDKPWVHFAHTLGTWEIGIGEILKKFQIDINASMQLLQVLMGADTQQQLLEMTAKLSIQKRKLPGLVKSILAGYAGGALAQRQTRPLFPHFPASFPDPASTPSTPTTTDGAGEVYPWSDGAKANSNLAPQLFGGVALFGGKAQLSALTDDAIGVAVSVDTTAKTVTVKTNGQKIAGMPAGTLGGLIPGDVLYPSAQLINGRYLITAGEAIANGSTTGTPVKPIARVLKNDAQERTITIIDQSIQPLPPG